ncbi:MAG TPA: FtsX-like permease family protein [Acidimicrobiales bacterium]|nr:FtsX-like permease family protein [Acidimicrobiales bacterium]
MIEIGAGVGAAVLVAMLAVAAHDLIRRPGFRRLAVRNLARRRTEAVLVVVGSSLGTAIIASAFLVGASFHASVRDSARTQLGPIDETVTVAHLDDLGAVTEALRNPALAHSDGILPALQATATVTSGGSVHADAAARPDQRAEPSADVLGLDVAAARSFGGRPDDTGLAAVPGRLGPGDAVVSRSLADSLAVGVGEPVTLHAYGTTRSFEVAAITDPVGLAGAAEVIVDPDALRSMTSEGSGTRRVVPRGVVFVSNDGGVFDGSERTDHATAAIRARLEPRFDVEIASSKADLLAEADQRGRAMGQLFTGVGTFSVLAGLLLLVNLFVMLAEERKRELGLARATGLERWHLMRVFSLEGLFYAVAASVLGCFAGAGLAWAVVDSASGLVGPGAGADEPGRAAFGLHLVLPTGLLITAGLIGLGLSMATVWITSGRIARLDIVRALRDLPEIPRRHHVLRSSGPAGIGVAAGAALSLWGLFAVVPLAAVLGPPIGLCSAIPLLRPIVGRRITTTIVSVGTLVWCVGVFTFVPRITDHTGIPVYVIQGVVMVAAAVGLATALDRTWLFAAGLVTRTGRGLAVRLGLAYPLEKVFRTGMLVGMYALIVFTLSFVAVYGQISQNQTATLTRQVAAGGDLLVDANPSNPPSASEVAAVPGVAGVQTVWRAMPRFTTARGGDAHSWPASGFDSSMLTWGVPHLTERAARFSSDRAVFEALVADPHLIVVDERFGDTNGVSASSRGPVGLGATVRAEDPTSGRSTTYRVVGVTSKDVTGAGSWVSASSLRGLSGVGAVPSRFSVRVGNGTNPDDVARRLQNELVTNGVQASTYAAEVADAMSVELGFLRLMQRYMAIGLVVGIAGLAVVMVRAARARRRQVGMLRVIGFSPDTVRGAFLIEATFIAGQGIATGVGLGLLVSFQMLSRSAALGGEVMPYAVPWPTIGLLAVVPFVASLVVSLVPAHQASSVDPAKVLRMAE